MLWALIGAEAGGPEPRLAGVPIGSAPVGHPVIEIGLWLATIAAFRLMSPAVQWRYHGAEHKAVTAYERGLDLGDVDSVLGCPRVHARCGTNLVVWLALGAPLISRLSGPGRWWRSRSDWR